MILALLPVFLILKHLLIANVFDVSYSEARDTRNKKWVVNLFVWISTELCTSYILYYMAGVQSVAVLLLAESVLCVTATHFERNAFLGSELKTYFLWEFIHFVFYVVVGFGT